MSITKSVAKLADSDNNPLIGEAQAHITDASVAHALNASFSDTEAEAALNALGGKVNAILLVLEAHGLVKTS
jgi:hypothetical protein